MRFEGATFYGGPAMGAEVELGYNTHSNGGSGSDGFSTITTAPAGMPSNPAVYGQPNPPKLFAG